MAYNCQEFAKLKSKGGIWKKLYPRDKIMASSWTYLILKGEIGEVLNKCKKVLAIAKWGKFQKKI